jgi:hypothetical protein
MKSHSEGEVQVAGIGPEGCDFGEWTERYQDGAWTATIGSRTIKITDQGGKLHIGERVFDLGKGKLNLSVDAQGQASLH